MSQQAIALDTCLPVNPGGNATPADARLCTLVEHNLITQTYLLQSRTFKSHATQTIVTAHITESHTINHATTAHTHTHTHTHSPRASRLRAAFCTNLANARTRRCALTRLRATWPRHTDCSLVAAARCSWKRLTARLTRQRRCARHDHNAQACTQHTCTASAATRSCKYCRRSATNRHQRCMRTTRAMRTASSASLNNDCTLSRKNTYTTGKRTRVTRHSLSFCPRASRRRTWRMPAVPSRRAPLSPRAACAQQR
jgi:hypothetical protein